MTGFVMVSATITPALARGVDCAKATGIRPIECGRAVDDHPPTHVEAEWWRPMVALYFEPGDVDRVICLMEKESGGDPEARNPSTGAAGLMQVMPFWAKTHGYSYEELFDPGINLWVASRIRDQQGWPAWSPYLRGACR
ncbi:MAG TPA: transglycosylase SLT domain-containing protein [Acidimicrobiia bacterium]|nr:transglycosylase SLT domain-containing protein [Acidimicrobiia bacterium]